MTHLEIKLPHQSRVHPLYRQAVFLILRRLPLNKAYQSRDPPPKVSKLTTKDLQVSLSRMDVAIPLRLRRSSRYANSKSHHLCRQPHNNPLDSNKELTCSSKSHSREFNKVTRK